LHTGAETQVSLLVNLISFLLVFPPRVLAFLIGAAEELRGRLVCRARLDEPPVDFAIITFRALFFCNWQVGAIILNSYDLLLSALRDDIACNHGCFLAAASAAHRVASRREHAPAGAEFDFHKE